MDLGTRTRTYDSIFAGGRFVRSDSGRTAEIVSPRTEEVIGREMGVEGLEGYVEYKSVAVSGPALT